MARCYSCSGVIAKTDVECYVCGEPVPGRSKVFLAWLWAKPAAPAKRAIAEDKISHSNQNSPRAA
jgi:hypothetical protein